MQKFVSIIFMIFALAIAAPTFSADAETQKKNDLQELFQITGADKIATQISNAISIAIVKNLKQTNPRISDRALKVVDQEVTTTINKEIHSAGGYLDQVQAIYSKHFSDKEIHDLLSFYKSDLGKKVVATMPIIMKENTEAASQMAKKQYPLLRDKISARLKKEKLLKGK